jgi:hypothetical protein
MFMISVGTLQVVVRQRMLLTQACNMNAYCYIMHRLAEYRLCLMPV